jgi:hypothetical protein
MTRHLLIFAACFLVGAVATAALRTARHSPYDGPPATAPPAAELLPAGAAHAGHQEAAVAPVASMPVNTICAICGMPVDPRIPTATYQGKAIGFGCKTCPAKFAANPELYGPPALQNRVVDE